MVFKNCHRPNSGTVIYTDKGRVTTVGGSAASLKRMKLIDLNQKEHRFCFFELGTSTFYCCVIKTPEQNCSFPFCCLFIATSPNPSILLLLSALHIYSLLLAWLRWRWFTAVEVCQSKQCRFAYRSSTLSSARLFLKSLCLSLHIPVHIQRPADVAQIA